MGKSNLLCKRVKETGEKKFTNTRGEVDSSRENTLEERVDSRAKMSRRDRREYRRAEVGNEERSLEVGHKGDGVVDLSGEGDGVVGLGDEGSEREACYI